MRCKYVGHKERAMEEEERMVEVSQVVGIEVSVDLPVLLLVLGGLKGGRSGPQNVEQDEGKHRENQEDTIEMAEHTNSGVEAKEI